MYPEKFRIGKAFNSLKLTDYLEEEIHTRRLYRFYYFPLLLL